MPILAKHVPAASSTADVWAQIERDYPREDAAPPTSLEALETTPRAAAQRTADFADGHPLEIQSCFQKAAHHPHQQARWHIVNSLWQEASSQELLKRAQRMGQCCVLPTLRLCPEKGIRPALARCRDRLCPLCATRRGRQAAHRTRKMVANFNAPRFVTLTLKHREASLDQELTRLHAGIKTLRAAKFWKQLVTGGVIGIEVTRNAAAAQWHVHAHLICDGRYIPHAQLKAAWLAITGDSHIVHVKQVPDRNKAADYIARYVAKPVDVKSWPGAALREYAEAMHGRRLIQPFGKCVGMQLDDDEDETPKAGTMHLCDSQRLLAAAANHPKAEHARQLVARLSTDHASAVGIRLEQTAATLAAPSRPEYEWCLTMLRLIGETPDALLHLVMDSAPECPPPAPQAAPDPSPPPT